ncbi:hypothetical protein [Pseudoclavibacter sp. AY1F1]|uniref:hypothetical protein n=1 Tax=Pseudoclavibacter sp. AY1F1 TaxID=2080583 RepID=UPI0011B01DC1|nr:hypothetical protein [Pseudoclavibacter sp. AY1F1]
MTMQVGPTAVPERLWMSMIARAVPALIIAAVITFSQDHSASFGFVTFGAFALASGVLIGFEAVGFKDHPARALTFVRAIVSALAGGFALFMGTAETEHATAAAFIATVATWALVTGALELVSARVGRATKFFSREVLITGAITVLLGLLVAIIPPDLRVDYGGLEQVEGTLTASVQTVGYVGAYLAVLGVLLVIEGITLRGILADAPAVKPELTKKA